LSLSKISAVENPSPPSESGQRRTAISLLTEPSDGLAVRAGIGSCEGAMLGGFGRAVSC
jgi:hypothetical protein